MKQDDSKNIKLEDLGFDEFFATARTGGLSIARVIGEQKGIYKIKGEDGERLAKVTGNRMFTAISREDYPAVGDWVEITKLDSEKAVIEKILPRRTIIKRRYNDQDKIQVIATNIDVALIVESMDRDYSLNRFERYFAIAKDGGVKPAIVLNKIDLMNKEDLASKLSALKERFKDTDVVLTSTKTNEGLDELRSYIGKGKTYCFLGSSGVGKSSLINTLLRGNSIRTGNVSSYSERGKHVTTSREMYFLENGGIVIDNPGMREVGMTDAQEGIKDLFDDIASLAEECRFPDCAHVHEPGCAVVEALKSGALNENRYSNYINLQKEAKHYEMTELERKEKEHQFGKTIKKAKEILKKIGHKDY